MKSVSKRLKILTFCPINGGLERNTVRVRMNVSYRHGTSEKTKTLCVRKDVVEREFIFFESKNKNHLVFHDERFIEAHLTHLRHDCSIKKLCANRPQYHAQFNNEQIKAYLAEVEPDGVENFIVNYGMGSLNHNGKMYSLPNVISIIIPDPTGRMQKINSLATLFGE